MVRRRRRRPLLVLSLLLVASRDKRRGESPGVARELARSLRSRSPDHPFKLVFVVVAFGRCFLRCPCCLFVFFSFFVAALPLHLPASGERQAQPQQLGLGAPADPPLRPRDPAAEGPGRMRVHGSGGGGVPGRKEGRQRRRRRRRGGRSGRTRSSSGSRPAALAVRLCGRGQGAVGHPPAGAPGRERSQDDRRGSRGRRDRQRARGRGEKRRGESRPGSERRRERGDGGLFLFVFCFLTGEGRDS